VIFHVYEKQRRHNLSANVCYKCTAAILSRAITFATLGDEGREHLSEQQKYAKQYNYNYAYSVYG
jgi:hypothetical protein